MIPRGESAECAARACEYSIVIKNVVIVIKELDRTGNALG